MNGRKHEIGKLEKWKIRKADMRHKTEDHRHNICHLTPEKRKGKS